MARRSKLVGHPLAANATLEAYSEQQTGYLTPSWEAVAPKRARNGCGGSRHQILAIGRERHSSSGGTGRPLPSEGGGHTFESCRARHLLAAKVGVSVHTLEEMRPL